MKTLQLRPEWQSNIRSDKATYEKSNIRSIFGEQNSFSASEGLRKFETAIVLAGTARGV